MKMFMATYLIFLSHAFAMGSLHLFPASPSTPDTVPDSGDMGGTISVLNQITPQEDIESQQDREEEKPKKKQKKENKLEQKKIEEETYPVERRRIHE